MSILALFVSLVSVYFLTLTSTILCPCAGIEAPPVDTWDAVREALQGPTGADLALHPRIGEDNAPTDRLNLLGYMMWRDDMGAPLGATELAPQIEATVTQIATPEITKVTAVLKPVTRAAEVVKFYWSGKTMGATVRLPDGREVSSFVKGLAKAPAGHRRLIALRALA